MHNDFFLAFSNAALMNRSSDSVLSKLWSPFRIVVALYIIGYMSGEEWGRAQRTLVLPSWEGHTTAAAEEGNNFGDFNVRTEQQQRLWPNCQRLKVNHCSGKWQCKDVGTGGQKIKCDNNCLLHTEQTNDLTGIRFSESSVWIQHKIISLIY